jgi:hypothetical protein
MRNGGATLSGWRKLTDRVFNKYAHLIKFVWFVFIYSRDGNFFAAEAKGTVLWNTVQKL